MNRTRRSRLLAASGVALITTMAVAACGSSSGGTAAPGDSTGTTALSGTVTVLAASSLTGAFTTLGKQFEAAHPGVKVTFSFAASSALAQQINQGAPADVFASASSKNMQQVTAAGGAATSSNFAKNVMEIAVPPQNPAGISGVDDLARKGVKVALCQAAVPCGATAATVFANAKVTVTPVTEEADVKSVLAKVSLGEVDAGVVYVTDVLAAGTQVKGIQIPSGVNASTEYPIAALSKAPNKAAAAAFVAYVLSPAGASVLTADGFQAP